MRLRRPLSLAVAALLTLVVAGCRNPRTDANMAEALVQLGTQMNGVQQDYAALQSEVDSLRSVVARQDTLLVRLASLANLAGVAPR